MNIIKGLIKKDLYNLSSYKMSLLIVIIFCGIAIIGTGNINFGPILICTIMGMISLSTFSYDEMSKSNKYILTLPTNRKEIIKSKYILAIGTTILVFILILLVLGIGYLIMNASFNINIETIENFMNQYGLILLVLLMAIMYLISYKVSNKIYRNKEE